MPRELPGLATLRPNLSSKSYFAVSMGAIFAPAFFSSDALMTRSILGIGCASEKNDFAERYKGKFVVVLGDGLAIGICASDGSSPNSCNGKSQASVRG
jgi:hypothetical protein